MRISNLNCMNWTICQSMTSESAASGDSGFHCTATDSRKSTEWALGNICVVVMYN